MSLLDKQKINVFSIGVAQVVWFSDISGKSRLNLECDVTVSVTVHPLEQFICYRKVLSYYINIVKEGIRYSG